MATFARIAHRLGQNDLVWMKSSHYRVTATAVVSRRLQTLSTKLKFASSLTGRLPFHAQRPPVSSYFFATQTSKDDSTKVNNIKNEQSTKTDSLRDAVNRLKGDETGETTTDSGAPVRSLFSEYYETFKTELSQAWQELLASGQRQDINKKIVFPKETPEGDAPYTGPVDIMVIDPSENLNVWERMQKRLTSAPIIMDILSRSERVYETSGAKKIKQKVDDLTEDAKEAWETSQNPWVYRISSVYDTLTAETAEAKAVRELQKLDPDFTLEGWRQDAMEHTLPRIIQWILDGRINQLKPWLGEAVFKRIASEIKARQKEGIYLDSHVLSIMNSEIVACETDTVEKGSPIILLHFMVQQNNCTRKILDNSLVDNEKVDDIKAHSYIAAFQREYNEEKGELNWKIIDFRFNGAIAYL